MQSGEDLRLRTKQFALRVIRAYSAVRRTKVDPLNDAPAIIGRQFLRSGTSVGAQYREACRARSNAEFVSKIESATQELDETLYWFELLVESGLVAASKLEGLRQEGHELLAIFVSSVITAKKSGTHKLPRRN